MKKQKYKAKVGSSFGNKDAQIIGEALMKLDIITPKNIIEEAKSKSSSIHNYFEWDDTEAGKRWRIRQAQQMTSHIITVVRCDNEDIEVRAFHSVKDKGKHFYVTTVEVIENENYRNQLVNEIVIELELLTYKMKLFRDRLK